MSRGLLILVVCGTLHASAFSQFLPRHNAVSFDIGGGLTIGVGVNYHRMLLHFRTRDGGEVGFLSAHVGAGLNAWLGSFALPHGLSLNLGSRGNYFEVGYTASYATKRNLSLNSGDGCSCALGEPPSRYYGMPLLGYRRQATRGFLFRVHVSPVIDRSEFYPWGGVSVGKAF